MRFVLRRVGSAVILLFAASLLVYVLLSPAFGDVARNILGENASEQQIVKLTEQLGLNQPVLVQYAHWLGHVFTGDLGTSYFTSQPVWDVIAARIPVTVSLVLLVTVFSGLIGFAVGVLAAVRRGWLDRILQIATTVGDALPAFIIALFLVTVVAVQWKLLPPTGYTPLADSPVDWARSLILPVVALTIVGIAGVAQQVRSATIATLDRDFVRTLRSRGLSEKRIILVNVLRNASTTGLTALAIQVVGILGGAVVVEQIFALPGLGSLAIEATARADLPIILGTVLAYVLIVVIVNLLVDLAVAWLNPKVRLS
ncbi:ABC transporter permease [Microbacterium sp.]|uniref:ABC transporter permease n=1 Tax=Microbacterium sp. TaxID=51671 RepID=UPI0009285B41|nr:ABC transporter permease [Microbacterium sp.]MBN9187397.1 ABC transporter permease [Microbacterium sp.]MBN9193906.1 ABC transporter permease [Microbacterium sp.]OJU70179.1 MAG: ABC transporter permease [Microbacterium sp. 70-38]